jgi:tRNA nucleotidyltransferase (CCA-adding enzyme)
MNPKIIQFAEIIKANSGTAYLVGGAVRDSLLGKEIKDYDLEIFGIDAAKLKNICESFGRVDLVGESFGVLKLHLDDEVIDVALPRTEKSQGAGHKNFIINSDPYMSVKDAANRRDFTFNALYHNIITGEVLDFYNGKSDLEYHTIRHVDAATFVDDSLRVLRAAQFAARFKFTIADETLELCKTINLTDLPADRIREELFKILLKSNKPSIGISYLHKTGATVQLFPELFRTNFSILNEAASLSASESDVERLTLMLAALLYQVPQPRKFLDKLQIFTVGGYNVRKQVLLLLEHADKPSNMVRSRANFLKLADTGIDIRILTILALAINSKGNNITFWLNYSSMNILIENDRVKPVLMGKHLLDLGYSASPLMGKILKEVFQKQLDDEINTLDDAISYVKNNL